MNTQNIVILISGRGSNMQAVVEARIEGANVVAVLANKADAAGLAWAEEQGIATGVVSHKDYPERSDFDVALMRKIDEYQPDWVVLAGFMRILTPEFCTHYAGRLINIHPSLLPAFTGLDTHRRALEAGCRVVGCTVHFVTAEMDCGPIIAQAAVPVADDDSPETLAARVLAAEHRLLPKAIADCVTGRVRVEGMRVHRGDDGVLPESLLL